jgi:zinc protease
MTPRRNALLRLLPVLFAAAGFAACGGGSSAGLSTELLSVPGYPLVSVRILVTVGSANDPSGREGLCRLAWGMLAGGGSRAAGRGEIAARLFPLGTEIGLSVDKEISVFSGTVRAGDQETFYSVLRECLLEPGFREEDFQRIKSGQLAELERDLPGSGNDDRLADEILNLMMYDGHPYGHPDLGLASSVKALSLDDVKNFYRRHFVQGNIILGLGGDYGQKLMSRAEEDFKKLPRGSTPLPALPAFRRPAGLEVGIAEKAVRADTIRLGFPLPVRRGDKDFFPLWIAAASLGESTMPFDRLIREDGTFAAGNRIADAAIEHPAWRSNRFPRPNHVRWQQHFSIRLAVPESGGGARAASGLLEAMRKLAAEGISEERFEITRARLQAEVRLYKRTLEEHLAWRMDSKLTGYLDFLEEIQYALPRVGRDDVSLAARTYLDPRSACLAVVTADAKAFAAEIAAEAVRTAPAFDFFKTPGWPGR